MRTGGIALILSALALGAAVFSLTRETQQTQRSPVRMDRVADLEVQVAELALELRTLKAERRGGIARDTPVLEPVSEPQLASPVDESGAPIDVGENDPALTAIVDAAVDRKTKRVLDDLRVKENKKPDWKVFASVLKLTDEQRALAERVVVEGQREVGAILETPTYDGVNLMDELVEIVAKGFAEPGKDHGWGPWIGKILSEKIPGTNDTYGARIETVKSEMRASFKRDWSEEQYREFESWALDPTEIQNVPGSPNEELLVRITERAKALGAEMPEDK